VDLLDGSSHDVDSNEQSFKMAAIFAMKNAFREANCKLLEPLMDVECTTPDEFQGDIMGDLNRRRGRIGEIGARNNVSIIKAEVPLAEMFGYSTDIRTLSSGRASYSMEPSHFENVPDAIVNELIEKRGGVALAYA
jgi:elongation factor G